MYKLYLTLLFSFLGFIVFSQDDNLLTARRSSRVTLVYRLTTDQALTLAGQSSDSLATAVPGVLVDSFRTEEPKLPDGNYLFVQAVEGRLVSELKSVGPLRWEALSLQRKLQIGLHDTALRPVTGAEVRLAGKRLKESGETGIYSGKKPGSGGLVTAIHQNVAYFKTIDGQKNSSKRRNRYRGYTRRRWWHTAFPFYLFNENWKRRKEDIRYKKEEQAEERRARELYGQKGYFITHQPMYKPGDTLRWKAFLLNERNEPIDDSLALNLTGDSPFNDTIIGKVKPYRPGAYEGWLVLDKAALKLFLDRNYDLVLQPIRDRHKSIPVSDWEEVLQKAEFRLEDYRLTKVEFNLRASQTTHHAGEPVMLYAKAEDDNGLPVLDGRLELQVQMMGEPTAFGESSLFVPQRMWSTNIPLEPIGETTIRIPDSVFPRASFSYSIMATMRTSTQDTRTSTVQLKYNYLSRYIAARQEGDSLFLQLMDSGRQVNAPLRLYVWSGENRLVAEDTFTTPARVAIHPLWQRYEVYEVKAGDSIAEKGYIAARQEVTVEQERTADSIRVSAVHPGKWPFWYALYEGRKLVVQGVTDSFSYAARAAKSQLYRLRIHHVSAGQLQTQQEDIAYYEKLLGVTVDQPWNVYPGQKATLRLQVSDADGRPVSGADVTAYGLSAKFSGTTPTLPYLDATSFRTTSRLYPVSLTSLSRQYRNRLQWSQWSKALGLSANKYYRFLYPNGSFTDTVASHHNSTELAPFIVSGGEVQPIHYLFIDEVPVYFSVATDANPYSFLVRPGIHSIRLRTHNRLVRLDSIRVSGGVKTVISIDPEVVQKQLTVQNMPDTLQEHEKLYWDAYMMLVLPNEEEGLKTIDDGAQIRRLNEGVSITGPITHFYPTFRLYPGWDMPFRFEGGFQYRFRQNHLWQRQIPGHDAPASFFRISRVPISPRFDEHGILRISFDSLWNAYLFNRNRQQWLFPGQNRTTWKEGRLKISYQDEGDARLQEVMNMILYRYDNPEYLLVVPGDTRQFIELEEGLYRMVVLMRGEEHYYHFDSIHVRPGGYTFKSLGAAVLRREDDMSRRLRKLINDRRLGDRYLNNQINDQLKNSFHQYHLKPGQFTRLIEGFVVDSAGNPVESVLVTLKGTTHGTVTDSRGYYQIRATQLGTLVFSAIGFVSMENDVNSRQNNLVRLTLSDNSIEEVVVVGYSTVRRRAETGAMSVIRETSLQGSVAGLSIRGVSSIRPDATPLYIVDGLPVADISSIPPDDIIKTEILKGASATTLYGAAAAGGAIVITTKKGAAAEPVTALKATVRRQFRDYAFWQPKLITDAAGKAECTVIYPDDIAAYKTRFIAATADGRFGKTEQLVRSFRQMNAQLSLPSFVLGGDTLVAAGKVQLYRPDSVTAERSWTVDGSLRKTLGSAMRFSTTDTLSIAIAPKADSVTVLYGTAIAGLGSDAEERKMPVLLPGVEEANGQFAALPSDTSVVWNQFTDTGKIEFYAEAHLLPTFYQEIERLLNYEHLCNEQLSSKLLGLLTRQELNSAMGAPFPYKKEVVKIINLLQERRNRQGLWGWFGGETEMWISRHTLRALLMARKLGYEVTLNTTAAIDGLMSGYRLQHTQEQMARLDLLHQLGAQLNYQEALDTMLPYISKGYLALKLEIAEMKAGLSLPYSTDSLERYLRPTLLGNRYFPGDEYHLTGNTVQNTLAWYRLMRHQGKMEQLTALMGYLLERRRSNYWGNTYEVSSILATLWPEVAAAAKQTNPVTLEVNGSRFTSFPVRQTIAGGQTIHLKKSGRLPVYATAYQRRWNPAPAPVSGQLNISARLSNRPTGKAIKGGDFVELDATITVHADADWLLVEIPIAAGFTYASKPTFTLPGEAYREYFRHKVCIYVRRLRVGTYSVSIPLQARFAGRFQLNPPKIEPMYFPTLFGRGETGRVTIE